MKTCHFGLSLKPFFPFALAKPSSVQTHTLPNPNHGTITFSHSPFPSAMPESRDRRITVVDLAAAIARRRASFIYIDSPPLRTPQRTAAIGRGRASGSPGSQNTPPSTARRGRGRVPSRNVLPAWYPRTPLRDITVVVQVNSKLKRSVVFVSFFLSLFDSIFCVCVRFMFRRSRGEERGQEKPKASESEAPILLRID